MAVAIEKAELPFTAPPVNAAVQSVSPNQFRGHFTPCQDNAGAHRVPSPEAWFLLIPWRQGARLGHLWTEVYDERVDTSKENAHMRATGQPCSRAVGFVTLTRLRKKTTMHREGFDSALGFKDDPTTLLMPSAGWACSCRPPDLRRTVPQTSSGRVRAGHLDSVPAHPDFPGRLLSMGFEAHRWWHSYTLHFADFIS